MIVPDPPPVIDWSATREDHARDLRAEFLTTYTHVPLSAPVSCGHAYLAAVRRAVAAEAQAAELQALVRGLSDRVAAQSELLTRRSGRVSLLPGNP